jgi:hypothetical protein
LASYLPVATSFDHKSPSCRWVSTESYCELHGIDLTNVSTVVWWCGGLITYADWPPARLFMLGVWYEQASKFDGSI